MTSAAPHLPSSTKMVVFDFDGTITRPLNGRTTWEMIWAHLGYTLDECAQYHARYRTGALTHTEWCTLTLEKFRARNLKRSDLASLAGKLTVLDGFAELVDELARRKIALHIVSGSIGSIIRDVLGAHAARFDSIMANEMMFGADGTLTDIVETMYDFEGKAHYIRLLVAARECAPADLLFVGNAGNDRWVAEAGVRTLCVNPTATDPDDRKAWTASVRDMRDMKQILDYV
jgi:HAD superfamily phosphoserine phosphatase-like hydrolase